MPASMKQLNSVIRLLKNIALNIKLLLFVLVAVSMLKVLCTVHFVVFDALC